jgi:dCTP deaminase
MSVLRDAEIAAELNGANPVAESIRKDLLQTTMSPVKGASLDLTVGRIFTPSTARDAPGGLDDALEELALMQGHTAVIETLETLRMPKDLAAIAFPPASVSMGGLLTTNPGHVDPGYEGPLHLTVINMGRMPFNLKRGDRIIRLIIFKLSGEVSCPAPKKPEITSTLLARLSLDFLNLDERASKAAKEEITNANVAKEIRTAKTTFYVGMTSAVVTLIVAALTFYGTSNARDAELRKKIADVESQVAGIESKTSLHSAINQISERLLKVETSIGNTPAGSSAPTATPTVPIKNSR